MQVALDAVQAATAPHQAFLLGTFLLSLRVSPIFMMTPLLQAFGVPVTVRVLLVLGLSVGLTLGVPLDQLPNPGTMGAGSLVAAALTELALGNTLALGVLTGFAAVSMAGRLIDVQVGFGIAQVFDPATSRQVPVLQAIFDRLAIVLFFILNGHHALLRGIAYSLDRFPLARPWPLDAAAPWVLKHVAALFGLGLALAAPIVVCLLMVELALGVLARNLPQMNMFVVGVPVKIIVGLAALTLWCSGIGNAMTRVYASIYQAWDSVFIAAPAEGRR